MNKLQIITLVLQFVAVVFMGLAAITVHRAARALKQARRNVNIVNTLLGENNNGEGATLHSIGGRSDDSVAVVDRMDRCHHVWVQPIDSVWRSCVVCGRRERCDH